MKTTMLLTAAFVIVIGLILTAPVSAKPIDARAGLAAAADCPNQPACEGLQKGNRTGPKDGTRQRPRDGRGQHRKGARDGQGQGNGQGAGRQNGTCPQQQ